MSGLRLFQWKFRPGAVKQRDVLVVFHLTGWVRGLHQPEVPPSPKATAWQAQVRHGESVLSRIRNHTVRQNSSVQAASEAANVPDMAANRRARGGDVPARHRCQCVRASVRQYSSDICVRCARKTCVDCDWMGSDSSPRRGLTKSK